MKFCKICALSGGSRKKVAVVVKRGGGRVGAHREYSSWVFPTRYAPPPPSPASWSWRQFLFSPFHAPTSKLGMWAKWFSRSCLPMRLSFIHYCMICMPATVQVPQKVNRARLWKITIISPLCGCQHIYNMCCPILF